MPPSRDGVDSMAMRCTRLGQPTAIASAVFDPQSCPATTKRLIFNASIRAIASKASMPLFPVLRAPAERNRVSPKPRRVGAMVRKPAALS